MARKLDATTRSYKGNGGERPYRGSPVKNYAPRPAKVEGSSKTPVRKGGTTGIRGSRKTQTKRS